jgi:hypothetical protein
MLFPTSPKSSRRMRVVGADLFDTIAEEAALESGLWRDCLVAPSARRRSRVFSPLCEPDYALAVETIYEGYLAHYGHPRLFAPADDSAGLLLGDYLYAHGLVRVAETGNVVAVADLAELISLCAQLRADERAGDGAAWAATAARLGEGVLADARAALRDGSDVGPLLAAARERDAEAVKTALEAHVAFLCGSKHLR